MTFCSNQSTGTIQEPPISEAFCQASGQSTAILTLPDDVCSSHRYRMLLTLKIKAHSLRQNINFSSVFSLLFHLFHWKYRKLQSNLSYKHTECTKSRIISILELLEPPLFTQHCSVGFTLKDVGNPDKKTIRLTFHVQKASYDNAVYSNPTQIRIHDLPNSIGLMRSYFTRDWQGTFLLEQTIKTQLHVANTQITLLNSSAIYKSHELVYIILNAVLENTSQSQLSTAQQNNYEPPLLNLYYFIIYL